MVNVSPSNSFLLSNGTLKSASKCFQLLFIMFCVEAILKFCCHFRPNVAPNNWGFSKTQKLGKIFKFIEKQIGLRIFLCFLKENQIRCWKELLRKIVFVVLFRADAKNCPSNLRNLKNCTLTLISETHPAFALGGLALLQQMRLEPDQFIEMQRTLQLHQIEPKF